MELLATGSIAEWVEAAPFRAHLRHLLAAGPLDPDDIAALAGISASSAQHLLQGRSGRPLRRICPATARRLLQITPERVDALSRLRVPAGLARLQLRRLRRWGWPDERIAARAGCLIVELVDIAAGAGHCSQLLVVRLTAAARAVDGERTRLRALPVPRIAG